MLRPVSLFFALAALSVATSCGDGGQTSQNRASAPPLTLEEQGRKAFAACAICHSVKDPGAPGYTTMVGPSLFRVAGAPAGHVSSYNYSNAMRESGLIWDDATLDAFIENPQMIVPRSRMAFAGEKNAERRAAIIAYLKTLE
ncbi:MAG: c-type cytochrome [Parvularculaceae bacterium]|nr:c-type cytochrome [Parvularculaceae bacterium]